MNSEIAGIKVPDSQIAKEAAELLRDYGTELLWNHSNRVFFFSSVMGKESGQTYDPELLYVSALFHDLGLTNEYSSENYRFEVDSANAAKKFLLQHQIPDESARLVWDAIALHTTIGIAEHREPQVSLLYSGVGLDVMGDGFDQFPASAREAIIKAYPRGDFKNNIIPAFYDGFKHKQDTTFGNINADVCAFMNRDYKRKNFCDCILHSPWKS